MRVVLVVVVVVTVVAGARLVVRVLRPPSRRVFRDGRARVVVRGAARRARGMIVDRCFGRFGLVEVEIGLCCRVGSS